MLTSQGQIWELLPHIAWAQQLYKSELKDLYDLPNSALFPA